MYTLAVRRDFIARVVDDTDLVPRVRPPDRARVSAGEVWHERRRVLYHGLFAGPPQSTHKSPDTVNTQLGKLAGVWFALAKPRNSIVLPDSPPAA